MSESSHSEKIGPLLDEFLDRLRRGLRPEISEYARAHPELADEIRETFSAVMMIHRAGPPSGGQARPGPAAPATPGQDPVPTRNHPDRIGDYRIIREIGRGGMGVVYEAVQESLARTVALKVLPRQLFSQPKLVERFQREARAAASLHHTNIVPVFSVGQQDDLFHYAMQFIDGVGVDLLISRMRDTPQPDIRSEISRIGTNPAQTVTQRDDGPLNPHADTHEHQSLSAIGGSSECNQDDSGSGNTWSGHDGNPRSSGSTNFGHFATIARLGRQVADGLQHAHERGILHRDIKPSNLLVDRQGTAWIADFGLAKASDSDLTRTGDVVGTLQYLAPERLKGKDGAAGDIFSLGLTLYELVTRIPAYSGSSQADLLARIAHGIPRGIRELNPDVPRDLATIIHKAMSPEPGYRYASAGKLAEDLDNFVEGRPILARRTGIIGRAALWARRNPAPAALLSLVALLIIALVAGSLFAAIRFASDNQLITSHLSRSLIAEKEKSLALIESRISQATALLESSQIGRSSAIRDSVSEAASLANDLGVADENRSRLNQIVFDLSGLLDLELDGQVFYGDVEYAYKQDAAFDSTLSRIARCSFDGDILIEDLGDSSRSFRLSGYWITDTPDNHPHLVFSPDDSRLAVRGITRDGTFLVQVFELGTRTLLLEQAADGNVQDTAIAFVGNDQIAFATAGNCVSLTEIRSGELIWTSEPMETQASWLAADRSGNVLAGSRNIVMLKGQTGKMWGQFANPSSSETCALHPLGRYFAAGYGSGEILVWDMADFDKPVYSLKGHSRRVHSLSFHPQENLLMSSSTDGTTRIWDTVVARTILEAPYGGIRFNRNGDKIGFHSPGHRYGTWSLAGLDQKILANGHMRDSIIRSIDFSQDSRLIGWASRHLGIVLAETSVPRTSRIFDEYQSAGFFAFGKTGTDTLVSAGSPTIDRFRYSAPATDHPDETFKAVRERSMTLDLKYALVGLQTPDGRFLITDGSGPLLQAGLDEDLNSLELPYSANLIAIDSTGTLLAYTSPEKAGVMIWSLKEQKPVAELQNDQWGSAVPEFDPQDRWLAVASQGHVFLFDTKTWTPSRVIRVIDSSIAGRCAFSPDGKLLAVSGFSSVALYDTKDFQLLGLLRPRNRASIASAVAMESCPIRFSPNSKFLAAGTFSNTVILWDMESMRKQLQETGLPAW